MFNRNNRKLTYYVFNLNYIIFVCLFFLGILSVQRFTLPVLTTWFCVLPFFISLVAFFTKSIKYAMTFSVISIILSHDQGGGAYFESSAFIRYPIYLWSLFLMLNLNQISFQYSRIKNIFWTCFLLIVGLFIGFINDRPFEYSTFFRDLLVLILILFYIFTKKVILIDNRFLFAITFGLLVGELLNIVFFYRDNQSYLNYNSTKVIIVYFLLFIWNKSNFKFILKLFALILVLVVFSMFGTRMILVSFIFLLVLILILNFRFHFFKKSVLVLCILSLSPYIKEFIVNFGQNSELTSFKVLGLLPTIFEVSDEMSILQILENIDKIRFNEFLMFFHRGILEVFFGSGLGSGIKDNLGLLSFVGDSHTAFSPKEIQTSTFFGFHDFWIDFGLRFGFGLVLIFFLRTVVSHILKGQPLNAILFGMLILNTTFSTQGIILTYLILNYHDFYNINQKNG